MLGVPARPPPPRAIVERDAEDLSDLLGLDRKSAGRIDQPGVFRSAHPRHVEDDQRRAVLVDVVEIFRLEAGRRTLSHDPRKSRDHRIAKLQDRLRRGILRKRRCGEPL
jgi:hypothetical protein